MLPNEWALYRITENTGPIFYIGITSKLRNRIRQHQGTGNFNPARHHLQYQMAALGASWDDLQDWEKRKIFHHQPAGVTYAGGNGRRPTIQINGASIPVAPGESLEDAVERHGLLGRFVAMFR